MSVKITMSFPCHATNVFKVALKATAVSSDPDSKWTVLTVHEISTQTQALVVGVLTRIEQYFCKCVLRKLFKHSKGAVQYNKCTKESMYNRCMSKMEVGATIARRA